MPLDLGPERAGFVSLHCSLVWEVAQIQQQDKVSPAPDYYKRQKSLDQMFKAFYLKKNVAC
jgi:hypothetical protein